MITPHENQESELMAVKHKRFLAVWISHIVALKLTTNNFFSLECSIFSAVRALGAYIRVILRNITEM